MKLILASQSPRRSDLLRSIGYSFEVHPSSIDETFDLSLPIDEALIKVAEKKAASVLKEFPEHIVLAADTIVFDRGKILGKPANEQEAFEMLKSLSGRSHEVKTGVVAMTKDAVQEFVETSVVTFRELSDQQILDYIHQGTCLDKAGSYGIQDVDFARSVQGSYSNVIGLPLTRTDGLLKHMQMDPSIVI